MVIEQFDVVVIGGGPGGLASASTADKNGAKVLLIEREAQLGGILKQCIHDGFGVTRFKEKLSGPEYAYREIKKVKESKVKVETLTFVTDIKNNDGKYQITYVNRSGLHKVLTKSLIMATGCRERTAKQVSIHGTNPAGVMTAGQAQYYINILGKMPIKKCVILGSGDIGLIMARRITLEGGEVEGVYEVKSTPSGLSRNIAQCLIDFNIPLYLSHTVSKVFGVDRLEAVEINQVDDKMNIIPNTSRIVECDSLILSVGLIPENELGKKLNIPINRRTKGPSVDQTFMTLVDNVYSAGNATHVNDLADYVSESGEIAGLNSTLNNVNKRDLVEVEVGSKLLYVVPNYIDFNKNTDKIVFYFRSKDTYSSKVLTVKQDGEIIYKKNFATIRPPEMERIVISLTKAKKIQFELENKQ